MKEVMAVIRMNKINHTKKVAVQRFLGGLDQIGMVGKAEIVIGAEIQNLAAVPQPDGCILGRPDDALAFIKTGVAHAADFGPEMSENALSHGGCPYII
ncbi:MAG: hypothetical protein MI741_12995 [Rhodospirillales bacterium]|nr:hypothetical protein [Rhodospirillales bacterium]